MDFIKEMYTLAKKIEETKHNVLTEEGTKTAFVLPFIHLVLGYDIFNPIEVIPEFTADACTKKGEKVDYALLHNNEMQMLIECKKYGEPLSIKHANQLFRYFSVTNVRIAILTNGSQYQFFTDLDVSNKMDEKPFLILDLENLDEHIMPEVKKMTKSSFDLNSIIDVAGELKYLNQIKIAIAEQFKEPDEAFISLFAKKVYDGPLTAKLKVFFSGIVEKALKQFLSDSINDRLKSAIIEVEKKVEPIIQDSEPDNNGIVTTEEELEGFRIVRSILRKQFDNTRIGYKDTKSYFGILLDDSSRKPLCRLYFNTKQKYLALFNNERNEEKHSIQSLDDIFLFTDQLLESTAFYLQNDNEEI